MNLAQLDLDEDYSTTMRIHAGSYSRLRDYEECPLRAFLKYAAKIPEPAIPEGKETPLDRGTRVHKDAELYIKGEKPITPELAAFEEELYALHRLRLDHPEQIELEQMWCFDRDLKVTAWNNWDGIWLRIKQDAVTVAPMTGQVICIDFKTGKKKGNEVKHNDQLRLAAVGALLKYGGGYNEFTLENWYTDQDELVSIDMSRDQVEDLVPGYVQRLTTMTTAETFEPRPNIHVCRFCPYKTGKINKDQVGTGHCSLNPA